MRQKRLADPQTFLQLADAAFTTGEVAQDAEPFLIGHGLEPSGSLIDGEFTDHGVDNASIFIDMSSRHAQRARRPGGADTGSKAGVAAVTVANALAALRVCRTGP